LLRSPDLVLMDEPLASLDRKRKDELLPYFDRLHDELSVPVIYVSHDIDEICRLCDHLVLLDEGKVAAASGSRRRADEV
jgi:molybdate transport system ATP-binding protein